jgi:hypothetical protein
MQKRTTLAAAAGLALALGAPFVASVPANAATAPTAPTQASSSASTSSTGIFLAPGVRSVDGARPELTNTEDGSPADLFSLDGHAATRTAEISSVASGKTTAHVEQRLDGEGPWREVASFEMDGLRSSAHFAFTVPEGDGYVEYRTSATNEQGDRTDHRTFFVVEY